MRIWLRKDRLLVFVVFAGTATFDALYDDNPSCCADISVISSLAALKAE